MLPLNVDNDEIPESSGRSSVISMHDFGLFCPKQFRNSKLDVHNVLTVILSFPVYRHLKVTPFKCRGGAA